MYYMGQTVTTGVNYVQQATAVEVLTNLLHTRMKTIQYVFYSSRRTLNWHKTKIEHNFETH